MKCLAFNHINCLIKKLKNDHDCQEYINIKALEKTNEEIKTMIKEMK